MDRYGQHINDILARLKATGGSIPVVLVADPASRAVGLGGVRPVGRAG